jgi:hypothetical protein
MGGPLEVRDDGGGQEAQSRSHGEADPWDPRAQRLSRAVCARHRQDLGMRHPRGARAERQAGRAVGLMVGDVRSEPVSKETRDRAVHLDGFVIHLALRLVDLEDRRAMPRESRFVSKERVILFASSDDRLDDSDDRPSFFDVPMESSDALMGKRDCLSRRRRSLSDLFAFLRHPSDCLSNDSDILSAWLGVLRDRSDCRRDGPRFHRDGSDLRPGRCGDRSKGIDGPAFGALTPRGSVRAPACSRDSNAWSCRSCSASFARGNVAHRRRCACKASWLPASVRSVPGSVTRPTSPADVGYAMWIVGSLPGAQRLLYLLAR